MNLINSTSLSLWRISFVCLALQLKIRAIKCGVVVASSLLLQYQTHKLKRA